jgi:hypothetical protein
MRIALAILLIPFSARAASLTGAVVDQTGAYVPHAALELDSGTNKYKVQADDAGVFQFSNLPAGEYMLTILVPGFSNRRVKSIELLEPEQKRIPDVTLDIEPCGWPRRDIILLPPGDPFGELSGTVLPPASGVEVFLICRTFQPCGSRKTDSDGHFSFAMLSAGAYGLSFHRDGFYDQDATAYEYYVNAGWESVYAPVTLEPCADGNCKAKIQRILPACE